MRIEVLGSVQLTQGPQPVPIGGGRRAAVLAFLALNAGRAVSTEQVIDFVWGPAAPPQARGAVQGHVSALRRLLDGVGGGQAALLTRAGGYLLEAETPEAVDVLLFTDLTARAAATADSHVADGLLRRALELWHGTPLSGLPRTPAREAHSASLAEARLQALELWAGLAVRHGETKHVLGHLEQAASARPLRESILALYIRALHVSGDSAGALAAYRDASERLGAELGLDPGPLLAAAAGEAVAAAADEPRAVPAQLPREPSHFTGRARECARLDRLRPVQSADGCAAAQIAVLTGGAGCGKSATAVHWARRNAGYFPDGQLHASLDGFDAPEPAGLDSVLEWFLSALGVPPDRIPADTAGRVSLYRDVTADRRLLVLLDDAPGAEYVRTLIPAGPGSATLVTSRAALTELAVADGAELVPLDALPEADALTLLDSVLGTDHTGPDGPALRTLAALCDRLPLALRLAAARLAAHPAWSVADLAAELEDETARLLGLDTYGSCGMIATLNLTRRRLDPAAARLLGLLSLVPTARVDIHIATAVLGADPAAARRALDLLDAYHLVVENTPGHYGCHDLIRLYSTRLREEQADPEADRAALFRLLDYYLELTSRLRAHMLSEQHQGHGALGTPPAALPFVDSTGRALRVFSANAAIIAALIRTAAAEGLAEHAWKLADNSSFGFNRVASDEERRELVALGIKAAAALGDAEGEVRLNRRLWGGTLTTDAQREEGVRQLLRVAEIARARGMDEDLRWIGLSVAIHLSGLGRLDEADRCFTRVLADEPNLRLLTTALAYSAEVLARQGRTAEALARLGTLMDLCRQLPPGPFRIQSLLQASAAFELTGDPAAALAALGLAREAAVETGDSRSEVSALRDRARVLSALGRHEQAAREREQALAVAERAGLAEAEAIRQALAVKAPRGPDRVAAWATLHKSSV
jgi:DNA-binding SARP family transcriptional activator/tetratricopeptide (TPR) repeat protein